MMEALSEDQRVIEGILEGERMRMEESFRSAAAARRVREEKRALEDAAEDSQTKVELLHKQDAQINELRRKHEAAQLAVDKAASSADGSGDMEERQQGEEKGDASGNEGNDDDDDRGLVASLRKAHVEQAAMLESSLAAKGKSAKHALRGRLAAQRATREAELVEKGASATEAAIEADKELASKGESQQQELVVRLAAEKKNTLECEASAQRKVRYEARAAA
ncbi:unnamed protein product, partial [Pylaiella littoralis]